MAARFTAHLLKERGAEAPATGNIDKVVSSAVITIAGVLAVVAIIRFVMPPLADATGSLTSSSAQINADIDQIIAVGAVSMPDSTTVEVWAKNIGSAEIDELAQMSVEFGPESNPVPYAYGGGGCTAPCWRYDLGGAETWEPGATLAITVELAPAAESGALYRATLHGLRGGQATATVRAP